MKLRTYDLVKRVVAFSLALCVALCALPFAAHAAQPANSQTLTISGLHEGDTVKLYRVVDFTYEGASDTYTWDFAPGGLKTHLNDSGVTIDGLTDDASAKEAAAKMSTYISGHSGEFTGRTKEAIVATGANTVGFEFTAPDDLGMYLVQVTPAGSTQGVVYQNALVKFEPKQGVDGSWTATLGSSALDMKQSNVTIDKKIDDGADGVDSSDAYGVGDAVPFKVEILVPVYSPDDIPGATFILTDTMSKGLTFTEKDLVAIKASGITLQEGSDYTLARRADGFTVEFKSSVLSSYGGQTLTLEYSATLNEGAVQTNPDTNEVTLDYTDGQITDKVTVKTYALNVLKKDEKGGALKGATFELYKKANKGDEGAVDLGDGKYGVLVLEAKASGDDGKIAFEDLGAGTYYLKETAAPDGYQLDKTVREITINAEKAGLDNIVELQVTNKKTPALPVTGGVGTIALTVGGVAIICVAVLVLRSRKTNE
ncbi:MAG: SpaH/EbpB family LPXTG-anchored major pilin [Collinsella sp.]|nr:SpaH/EbpB family LPXTG-anchored major pilin [Collinsella sp.]